MANYSTLKYKSLAGAGFAKGVQIESLAVEAGFAKSADVSSTIDARVTASKRSIIGQLDREIAGGNATTDTFLDRIIGGNATTTSFAAEYDGGSANG